MFSTNKKEKIYCELLGINITMINDELRYILKIKSKYTADDLLVQKQLDEDLFNSFETRLKIKHFYGGEEI